MMKDYLSWTSYLPLPSSDLNAGKKTCRIIVVAVFCLCVGHPGLALEGRTLETEHNPLSFSDDQSNSMSPGEKAHQSA